MIIELAFIKYGSSQYSLCEIGSSYCHTMLFDYMILGIAPSAIISVIVYSFIKWLVK